MSYQAYLFDSLFVAVRKSEEFRRVLVSDIYAYATDAHISTALQKIDLKKGTYRTTW